MQNRHLIESLLCIDDKQGVVVPFKLNAIQQELESKKGSRNIILKARQLGVTSYILADMFAEAITTFHTPTAVVSHETRATQRLLDRVQFFYDTMHEPKPLLGAESRSEKTFPGLHSSIYIGTAGCLHPETSVLLEEGRIKQVKDVQVGDKVYRGRGRQLQKVNAVITRPYLGKMAQMIARGNPSEPIIVTPDHRFQIHKRWNSAETIISPSNSRGKRVCYFIRQVSHNIKEIGFLKTDYELGWVFGLYMAEGWYGNAYTSFGLNSNEIGLRDRLVSFANRYTLTFRWRLKGGIGYNGMEVSLGSQAFMRIIAEVFTKEKKVPDWFWDCGKDFLNGVIDGYVDGDGYKGEHRTRVTSIRPYLLYQLRDMLLSVRGIYSGIYKLTPRESFGGRMQKQQWELDFPISKGIRFHKVRKNSKSKQFYTYISIPVESREIDYEGTVYDLDCGGSFSTPFCLVHNSRAFGRGDTIRKALLSELAFYEDPERILAGVEDAVPYTGELTIESTPNGEDNIFYERWVRAREGRSTYIPFFLSWWLGKDYSLPYGSPYALESDKGELTFTDEEGELVEKFGLTEDQIRWRRMKIAEKGGMFYRDYPEDEVTCFHQSGEPVFDSYLIQELAKGCGEGQRHPSGFSIWIPPVGGMSYVVGADSSAGEGGGSFSAAAILDVAYQVVATYQGRVEPYRFAQLLKEAGTWYNIATLAVERNFTGYAVLSHLTDYPNLYLERDFITGRVTGRPGWWTAANTREYLFSTLKEMLPRLKIWDVNIVRQARGYRYIRHKATPQSFDDLLIATMIAVAVRKLVGGSTGYRGKIPGWGW